MLSILFLLFFLGENVLSFYIICKISLFFSRLFVFNSDVSSISPSDIQPEYFLFFLCFRRKYYGNQVSEKYGHRYSCGCSS